MGLQDHIRDLGLDAYTGRRPRKRIALWRRHRAALRARKVSFLRLRNAPGRRLFLGMVYPQSMYGVQQFGLSPTAVRKFRRQAARACSTLGQGVKSIPPTSENWLRKLYKYSKKNYKSTEDKHETNHINNKYNDTNMNTGKTHNT